MKTTNGVNPATSGFVELMMLPDILLVNTAFAIHAWYGKLYPDKTTEAYKIVLRISFLAMIYRLREFHKIFRLTQTNLINMNRGNFVIKYEVIYRKLRILSGVYAAPCMLKAL